MGAFGRMRLVTRDEGIISLKRFGGKMAPKLVYSVLEKELFNNLSETSPRFH